MAIDVSAYMTELAEAAGIPEADRPAFLSNEKVKAVAHKSLEAVEREKGRAEKASAEATRVYEENLKIFANNKAAVEAAEKRVQSYVEKFGELPGGGDPNNPTAVRAAVSADAIDKKALDASAESVRSFSVGIAKSVAKITAKHLKDFNEEPDLDAIEEIALKQGMTADKAYQEWRRPKDEERAKAAQVEAVKKAREEGEIEGRSKVAASTIADSDRHANLLANIRKQADAPGTARESFIQGWREAGRKGDGAA